MSDVNAAITEKSETKITPKTRRSTNKASALKADSGSKKRTKTEPGQLVVSRVLKVQVPIMEGNDIKALQKSLIAMKCPCGVGGADGRYGKDTAYAVRCFQARSGLVVDGKAGMHTIKMLGGEWKPGE